MSRRHAGTHHPAGVCRREPGDGAHHPVGVSRRHRGAAPRGPRLLGAAQVTALACVAAVLVGGCGGGDSDDRTPRPARAGLAQERRGDLVYLRGGAGPGRVTVIRRADAAGRLPLVLFLHGWGATDPRTYRPWLEHLARAGNAVVYPRYQDSFAEPPPQVLGNAIAGLRTALQGIDEDRGSLVVAGHSAGGALAADYAAIAARVRLPRARAVLSIFPGRGLRRVPFALPAIDPAGIPAGTTVRVLTGAADRVVDPADAAAIVRGALRANASLEVIRSRGAADHLAPQRATRISRRVFWTRLDRLIARVR